MTPPRITVFAEFDSLRLRYTLELCLKQLLGCPYDLVFRQSEFNRVPEPRVWYSKQAPTAPALWLPEEGLLRETRKIRAGEPESGADKEGWFCFKSELPEADLPFDLLAAAFYFASRYEEYILPERDVHGRFPSTASLAYRNNCLERPVVEEWVHRLRVALQKRFPNLNFPPPRYHVAPSYDIDIPWAYRHRPWWRTALSWARILLQKGIGEFVQALQIATGRKDDPYDCFDWLEAQHRALGLKATYFFPVGDYSRFDKNPHYRNRAYRQLISTLAKANHTGLHPSYYSRDHTDLLRLEHQRLEAILNDSCLRSRQHYLRFQVPETYQELEALGIRQEYSMGFADAPGYRAGLSTPFIWYDLSRERISQLQVVPFMAMDVSLKGYQHLQPDQALLWLRDQVDYLKKHGGYCCTIWHNNSLSEQDGWQGWRAVYHDFLKYASNPE